MCNSNGAQQLTFTNVRFFFFSRMRRSGPRSACKRVRLWQLSSDGLGLRLLSGQSFGFAHLLPHVVPVFSATGIHGRDLVAALQILHRRPGAALLLWHQPLSGTHGFNIVVLVFWGHGYGISVHLPRFSTARLNAALQQRNRTSKVKIRKLSTCASTVQSKKVKHIYLDSSFCISCLNPTQQSTAIRLHHWNFNE